MRMIRSEISPILRANIVLKSSDPSDIVLVFVSESIIAIMGGLWVPGKIRQESRGVHAQHGFKYCICA